jgi:hypothetical protein
LFAVREGGFSSEGVDKEFWIDAVVFGEGAEKVQSLLGVAQPAMNSVLSAAS